MELGPQSDRRIPTRSQNAEDGADAGGIAGVVLDNAGIVMFCLLAVMTSAFAEKLVPATTAMPVVSLARAKRWGNIISKDV